MTSIFIALPILQPLTLYHCVQLSHLQTSKYDGQDTLCIHYLGKVYCATLFSVEVLIYICRNPFLVSRSFAAIMVLG